MKNFMFLAALLTIGTFSCTALSVEDAEITNDQIVSNDQITGDDAEKIEITGKELLSDTLPIGLGALALYGFFALLDPYFVPKDLKTPHGKTYKFATSTLGLVLLGDEIKSLFQKFGTYIVQKDSRLQRFFTVEPSVEEKETSEDPVTERELLKGGATALAQALLLCGFYKWINSRIEPQDLKSATGETYKIALLFFSVALFGKNLKSLINNGIKYTKQKAKPILTKIQNTLKIV